MIPPLSRRIAVVAFVLSCGCAFGQPSARPGQSDQGNRASDNTNDTAEQLKAIAAEIRTIREQQAKTETREAAYEAAQRNNVYWPPIWSNWVLAGFAAIAALIAAFALRASTKQASAMRASVEQTERHFELQNAQWLDTGQFWCELDPISDSGQPGRWDWRFDFQIRNNTPFQLTVVRIEYFVCADSAVSLTQQTIGPRNLWKVPPVRTGALPETVAQVVSGKDNLTASMIGRIHYLNAMSKPCIQRFGKSGPLVPGKRTRLRKGVDGDLEQIIRTREKFVRERQEERRTQKQEP